MMICIGELIPFPLQIKVSCLQCMGLMVLDYTLQRTGLLTPLVVRGHMTMNVLVTTV